MVRTNLGGEVHTRMNAQTPKCCSGDCLVKLQAGLTTKLNEVDIP